MKLNIRHKKIGIFKRREVVEIDTESLQHVFDDILTRMEKLESATLTSEEDFKELMDLQANATFIALLLPLRE